MPFQTPSSKSGRSTGYIEDGIYGVQLVSLEDDFSELYQKPQIKWEFALYDFESKVGLVDGDGDPVTLLGWTGTSMHTKSRARPWAEALLGRPIVDGEDPEEIAAEITGKFAVAVIKNVAKEDGTTRPRIDSLAPLKAKAAAQPAAAARPRAAAPTPAGAPAPWE